MRGLPGVNYFIGASAFVHSRSSWLRRERLRAVGQACDASRLNPCNIQRGGTTGPATEDRFQFRCLSAKSDFALEGGDVVDSSVHELANESSAFLNNPCGLGRFRPLGRIGGEFPKEPGVNLSLAAFTGTRQRGAYRCIPDVNFSCTDHSRQNRSNAI